MDDVRADGGHGTATARTAAVAAAALRRAMAERPHRFLRSSVPWRCAFYAASGVVSGACTLLAVTVTVPLGVLLSPVLLGLVLLAGLSVSGVAVGMAERHRVRLLGVQAVRSPHRVLGDVGLRTWLRVRWREPVTWRELRYALLSATVLWLLDFLAVAALIAAATLLPAPLWYALFADGGAVTVLNVVIGSSASALTVTGFAALVLVTSGYVLTASAAVRLMLVHRLLAPAPSPGAGDMEPVQASGRLVDAFDAERRRIERNLHDGTQQRLIGLTMTLDMARMRLEEMSPDGAGRPLGAYLDKAQHEAAQTLAELRELVHGIHPHVLTERGLTVAVEELASRHTFAVDVDLRIAGRLPDRTESTGYFVISEALANVAKHSGCDRAQVRGWVAGGDLVLEIEDAGTGGAAPERGSGLRGLAERVAGVGGRLLLASPRGGPTVLRTEIPCVAAQRPAAEHPNDRTASATEDDGTTDEGARCGSSWRRTRD
ncbi:sensor histidine kinase [Actinomadura sp. KC345]|uniref:sensor histidine kinase n=1 Tax=Actinomadura sp. KC345 TaxID=2530371 RepID=UPI00104B954D|nr:sensor histidine kinase [Actinomadura sp. KC345]TDC58731.1 sensor histidine kinase [Actinomadura sp. KC345]